jgi:hypothetical protein
VNFRVTDEELTRLRSASSVYGAKCLSDFARAVMLGTPAESDPPIARIEEKIRSLEARLAAVESDVLRLIKTLFTER